MKKKIIIPLVALSACLALQDAIKEETKYENQL